MLCIDLDNKQFVKQGCIKYSYDVKLHDSLMLIISLAVCRECAQFTGVRRSISSKSTICIWIFHRPLCFPITQLEYGIAVGALWSGCYQQHTNDEASVCSWCCSYFFFSRLLLMGLEADCYALKVQFCVGVAVIYHGKPTATECKKRCVV